MIAINNDEKLPKRIIELISKLNDEDGLKRQEARQMLIQLDGQAVPELIRVVADSRNRARWEAIKALGRIRDPRAASILTEALMDEDTGIRWAASNALIALDRDAIVPLLVALTRHFDSVQLREVAHHIFHVLKDHGRLWPIEIEVYEALEGVEPFVEVPWAAEAALEELIYGQKRHD